MHGRDSKSRTNRAALFGRLPILTRARPGSDTPFVHMVLKYSCTNWTAIAPSPTADATRLTDPDRTSPAANTPGRLVSSMNGGRRAVQWRDCARAAPVRTNALASRSISGGSHSVRGTAPMKLNSAGVSRSC